MVTGSTAGIGFAAVFGLARLGASVIVNGRMQARVDRAMRGIHDDIADAKVTGIAADLALPDGVAHVTKTYLVWIDWSTTSASSASSRSPRSKTQVAAILRYQRHERRALNAPLSIRHACA